MPFEDLTRQWLQGLPPGLATAIGFPVAFVATVDLLAPPISTLGVWPRAAIATILQWSLTPIWCVRIEPLRPLTALLFARLPSPFWLGRGILARLATAAGTSAPPLGLSAAICRPFGSRPVRGRVLFLDCLWCWRRCLVLGIASLAATASAAAM